MVALVVDDSRVVRALLRGILRDLNFEVVESGDGLEALEKLEANQDVDVALIDWKMPKMNGVQFVRAVRVDLHNRTLPLVMVTSVAGMDHVTKALGFGANDYIMKPFTKETIVEKLRMLGVL